MLEGSWHQKMTGKLDESWNSQRDEAPWEEALASSRRSAWFLKGPGPGTLMMGSQSTAQ